MGARHAEGGVHEAALACKDARSALFVGRGMGAAISNEGALKLKEISYLHAEAYAAGEMKHGHRADRSRFPGHRCCHQEPHRTTKP